MAKKYHVEIKKHDPDDEAENKFDTISEAYHWVISMRAYGFRSDLVWVNGERFKVKSGIMYNVEPEDVLDDPAKSVTPVNAANVLETFFESLVNSPFRPQPTRGMAPQNPDTLATTGKAGV